MGFKIGATVLFDFAGSFNIKGRVIKESHKIHGLHDKFLTIKSGDTKYPIREKEVKKCGH